LDRVYFPFIFDKQPLKGKMIGIYKIALWVDFHLVSGNKIDDEP
jgi:hypothetical protein